MRRKAHKKRYWVTPGAFVVGIFLAFLVFRSANSSNCGIFAPIIMIFGFNFTIILFVLGLPLIVFLVERRFVCREEIEAKKRARAILRREEAKIKAEETRRKEEEDRRFAEANAELWSERWEGYIKPLLKFILIALAILIAIIMIVGGIESFISSFGIIAFLLVIIIVILLIKR